MALDVLAITSEIAEQSVSGVTIKDVDNTPDSFTARDCPILFPTPGAWLGAAGTGAPETETTFGAADARLWHVYRELRYTYLQGLVGTERETNKHYGAAVPKMEAVYQMLLFIDVSGVDIVSVTHTPIGMVEDGSGTQFIGANWTITVRERINA